MVHLVVINLASRTDRWESLTAHLEKFRPHLPFVEHVHRMEGVVDAVPARGCMASHRDALLLAMKQQWDMVLVAEDDIRFQPDAATTWSTCLSELKNSTWGVAFGATVQLRTGDFTRHSDHVLQLNPQGIVTGTHCVLYHSRAYQSVIRAIENEMAVEQPFHLDLLLSMQDAEFPLVLFVPFLALFTEHDTSDVRRGRDTRVDFRNITQAQQHALLLRNYL